VTIQEGTFKGLEGDVVEGLNQPGRFRVEVIIFGRAVHVELECAQICGSPLDESAWLACGCTRRLRAFLNDSPRRPSARKWRLFACACLRRLTCLLPNKRWRELIDLGERYADRTVARRQLSLALRALGRPQAQAPQGGAAGVARRRALAVMLAARACALPDNHVWRAADALDEVQPPGPTDWRPALFRDIVGNPFRWPAVDPAWLTWSGGAVPRLAGAIYEEQRWQDMPVLADALEDAGCTEDALLSHCRAEGAHARGCWLLDLVLKRS
jgi:hypothetical protein